MNLKEFILTFLLVSALIIGFFSGLIWLFSRNLNVLYVGIAILVALLDILLVAWIIFSAIRYRTLWKTPITAGEPAPLLSPKEEIRAQWEQIQALANSQVPSEWNMAILRADALLDATLKDLGYQGEDFAARLKIVDPGRLPSLDRIWSAHRLRNMIAHEPLEQHPRDQIAYALQSYEYAFKELDLME